MKLQRTMIPLEVKDAILRLFKDLHITSFVVLDTVESGHTLVRADNQELDGVSRRGSLCLCEKFEVR